MGTFTKLSDQDMHSIGKMFSLGTVSSWKPIVAGTINSNFVVHTDKGQFFVRINEGKGEEDVRYESDLVVALAQKGVPAPLPIAAGKQRYALYQEHWVSVFPWLEGWHVDPERITVRDVRMLGEALARLHVAGESLVSQFSRAGIYTVTDLKRRFASFASSQDVILRDAIVAIAEEFDWLEKHAETRAAVHPTIIHGDLFMDNVLFHKDGLLALIDFEQASTGSAGYDLAVCINAWCFGNAFKPHLVQAMVAGYQSCRPLTVQEQAALYIEARLAAMRFTVTRITDIYLAKIQSAKDFRRYLKRLLELRSLGKERFNQWWLSDVDK